VNHSLSSCSRFNKKTVKDPLTETSNEIKMRVKMRVKMRRRRRRGRKEERVFEDWKRAARSLTSEHC